MLPRVYPILDTASLERRGVKPVAAAEAMLEGGAGILQYRHKAFWSREIVEEAAEIARLCAAASAVFIVNDRADYARILNAGVHLGQEDLTPGDARAVIGTDAIIGFSTHNPEQVAAGKNEAIQYLAFGPIFPTTSKALPSPVTGLDSLAAIRAMTRLPLVAIGGITRENAAACWSAGADSVAVIADLLPDPCTPRAMRERMAEWNRCTLASGGGFRQHIL